MGSAYWRHRGRRKAQRRRVEGWLRRGLILDERNHIQYWTADEIAEIKAEADGLAAMFGADEDSVARRRGRG